MQFDRNLDPASLATLQTLRNRMRYIQPATPVEDRDDVEQNIFARLQAEANRRGIDVDALVSEDADYVRRAVVAERSRARRLRKRLPAAMAEEMAESLPAEMVMQECETAEVCDLLCAGAALTDIERQYLYWRFTCGETNYDQISQAMGIAKRKLYRIDYNVKRKLAEIPDLAASLLEGE